MSQSHKHLGLHLTSNLDWSLHVHETCLRANRKLSVLRSVKYLSRSTLDLLYKLTVRSVVDYGLLVYGSSLKQTDLTRLERLQYRAAKVVTGALHFTSRVKLNAELGWEDIKTRIDFLSLSFFHKIYLGLTRDLVTTCMPKMDTYKRTSRYQGNFKPLPYISHKYSKSFYPYYTKKWNSLHSRVRCCFELDEFKEKLKAELKPNKIKHFNFGSKYGNTLHTRLRVGRSYLNSHKYSIGLADSPACLCHHPQETTEHFVLDCFLYPIERQNLFSLVSQQLPNFEKLPKYKKLDILLNGISNTIENRKINNNILRAFQTFLIQTKRFSR